MIKKFFGYRKNKHGFTLVELLVVLVIIAILAAAVIPSMMGFIDRAKNESAAECRNVLLAANVELNELYGLGVLSAKKIFSKAEQDHAMQIAGIEAAKLNGPIVAETTEDHFFISKITDFKASNGLYYQYKAETANNGKWEVGTKDPETLP